MSRSRRKTPITGIAICGGEKLDKRYANRKLRAALRSAIVVGAKVLPNIRDVSSASTFGKDGKQWLGDRHPGVMRK